MSHKTRANLLRKKEPQAFDLIIESFEESFSKNFSLIAISVILALVFTLTGLMIAIGLVSGGLI